MKWFKNTSLILTLVSGFLMLVFLTPSSGWRAFDVATGSMKPAINPGSLVLTHQAPAWSLKVGQVVTYLSPANPKQTITHHIVALRTDHGLTQVTTKGDANHSADPTFAAGRIVGRVDAVVPGAGSAASWLRSPIVALIVVIIPAIIVIIGEMGVLWRLLSESVEPERRRVRRLVDGLSHRPVISLAVAVLLLVGLASGVGVTWAALTSKATLTGNHITIATPTPTPTASPTASPSPAPTGTPGECGDVTISNTAPGSVNRITCTNSSIQTQSDSTSINVTTTNTSTTSVGGINH
jgi:signal peptidase I